MKTIIHKLLSKPEIEVKLPEKTQEHFADLVIMLDSAESLTDFKGKMEKDSYFSGIEGVPYVDFVYTAGKLKRIKSLASKLKYIDDIYLQIAQYDLRSIIDDTESEAIKKEAKDMNSNLDGIYKQIYSRSKK